MIPARTSELNDHGRKVIMNPVEIYRDLLVYQERGIQAIPQLSLRLLSGIRRHDESQFYQVVDIGENNHGIENGSILLLDVNLTRKNGIKSLSRYGNIWKMTRGANRAGALTELRREFCVEIHELIGTHLISALHDPKDDDISFEARREEIAEQIKIALGDTPLAYRARTFIERGKRLDVTGRINLWRLPLMFAAGQRRIEFLRQELSERTLCVSRLTHDANSVLQWHIHATIECRNKLLSMQRAPWLRESPEGKNQLLERWHNAANKHLPEIIKELERLQLHPWHITVNPVIFRLEQVISHLRTKNYGKANREYLIGKIELCVEELSSMIIRAQLEEVIVPVAMSRDHRFKAAISELTSLIPRLAGDVLTRVAREATTGMLTLSGTRQLLLKTANTREIPPAENLYQALLLSASKLENPHNR